MRQLEPKTDKYTKRFYSTVHAQNNVIGTSTSAPGHSLHAHVSSPSYAHFGEELIAIGDSQPGLNQIGQRPARVRLEDGEEAYEICPKNISKQ